MATDIPVSQTEQALADCPETYKPYLQDLLQALLADIAAAPASSTVKQLAHGLEKLTIVSKDEQNFVQTKLPFPALKKVTFEERKFESGSSTDTDEGPAKR